MEKFDLKKAVIVLDGVTYYNLDTIKYLVNGMIEAARDESQSIIPPDEVESGADALTGFVAGLDIYDQSFSLLGKKVQLVEDN